MATDNYDDPSVYNDYQGVDTGCCNCPAGLVEVDDENGDCKGCLTPSDAERYEASLIQCSEGHVKVFDPTTNMFVGCLTKTEALDYYSNR